MTELTQRVDQVEQQISTLTESQQQIAEQQAQLAEQQASANAAVEGLNRILDYLIWRDGDRE